MLIVLVSGQYYVCQSISREKDSEVEVHFFNGGSRDPRKRKYRPVYTDPRDNKEVITMCFFVFLLEHLATTPMSVKYSITEYVLDRGRP